jgi:hypothetical protein
MKWKRITFVRMVAAVNIKLLWVTVNFLLSMIRRDLVLSFLGAFEKNAVCDY